MAGMNDRSVNEFVMAVEMGDPEFVDLCFRYTDPRVLAEGCAALLLREREVLDQVRGVHPVGVSKRRVWEIALASDERRAA